MKWFKHESDAYTNLKLEQVLDEFGLHGYGFFWLCLELVGHQGGDDFMLKPEKSWKNSLMRRSKFNESRLDSILIRFAELHLIDEKALRKGILYIPKMEERCDVYTNRVRTKYAHSSHNVPLEEKRIDKKRREETPQAASGTDFKNYETKGTGGKSWQKVGEILKGKKDEKI